MTLPISAALVAPVSLIKRGDLGRDLVGAEPRRQIAFEHLQLGLFLFDQIGAVAGGELRDRVFPLLDQLVDDRDDRGVVELDPLVDLALLERREQAADRQQARRILGAHGALHVVGDAVFQAHGDRGQSSGSIWLP